MNEYAPNNYEEEPRLDPLTSACLKIVSRLPRLTTPEEEDLKPPENPLHSLGGLELPPEIQQWISRIYDPSNPERSGYELFEETLVNYGILADYGEHGYLLGEQGIRLVEWTFKDGKLGAKAAMEASGLKEHHFCTG